MVIKMDLNRLKLILLLCVEGVGKRQTQSYSMLESDHSEFACNIQFQSAQFALTCGRSVAHNIAMRDSKAKRTTTRRNEWAAKIV